MEDYRNRKLMVYYLEPVAIKYDLTLEEARCVLALSHQLAVKDKRELADFLEVSQQHLALILGKLNKKECLKVNKKRGQEKLEITFFLGADKIMGELRQAEKEFEKARFAGITEDELREYYRLSAKMKENAMNIILK